METDLPREGEWEERRLNLYVHQFKLNICAKSNTHVGMGTFRTTLELELAFGSSGLEGLALSFLGPVVAVCCSSPSLASFPTP